MVSTRVSSVRAQGESGNGEPGGKAWERVDRSTLQLISNLFPVQTCGRAFFARFVERAILERSVIPDVAEDTVYICTQSIATLGEELGLPNETTHKYVKLYTALGLLRKQKFMGKLAFLLSVGIYHPPATLERDLDFLIQHSRPKLRTMAADVKARCKLYGLISQNLVAALEHLSALLQWKGGSKHVLEQQVAQAQALTSTILASVLAGHLPAGGNQRDAIQGGTAHHLLIGQKRGDDTRGRHAPMSAQSDSPGQRGSEAFTANQPLQQGPADADEGQQEIESTHDGAMEGRQEKDSPPNPPGLPAPVDAEWGERGAETTRLAHSGRRAEDSFPPNPPDLSTRVDSTRRDQGSESIRPAGTGRRSAQTGAQNLPASAGGVDSGGFANVNVGNVIKSNINVNVEIVAALMCRIFGEPPLKQGIYAKLFRNGCNQAEAIHAAAIFALVHFHRDGTIDNPAAVFVARCKAYHKTGIPTEAAELLAEYGALTYQQLLDKARSRPPEAAQTSAPARAAPPGYSTPASLPPLPKPTDLKPRIPLRHGGGMTRENALRLRAQIAHDRRVGMCQTGIAALSDGTYAVLLDNTVSAARVRQAAVYTADEWQERHQEVCAALFASAGRDLAKRRLCLLTKGSERP